MRLKSTGVITLASLQRLISLVFEVYYASPSIVSAASIAAVMSKELGEAIDISCMPTLKRLEERKIQLWQRVSSMRKLVKRIGTISVTFGVVLLTR